MSGEIAGKWNRSIGNMKISVLSSFYATSDTEWSWRWRKKKFVASEAYLLILKFKTRFLKAFLNLSSMYFQASSSSILKMHFYKVFWHEMSELALFNFNSDTDVFHVLYSHWSLCLSYLLSGVHSPLQAIFKNSCVCPSSLDLVLSFRSIQLRFWEHDDFKQALLFSVFLHFWPVHMHHLWYSAFGTWSLTYIICTPWLHNGEPLIRSVMAAFLCSWPMALDLCFTRVSSEFPAPFTTCLK